MANASNIISVGAARAKLKNSGHHSDFEDHQIEQAVEEKGEALGVYLLSMRSTVDEDPDDGIGRICACFYCILDESDTKSMRCEREVISLMHLKDTNTLRLTGWTLTIERFKSKGTKKEGVKGLVALLDSANELYVAFAYQ